jgi:NodT family efflux transporter outer membrane factor (OMF) lipoprotein
VRRTVTITLVLAAACSAPVEHTLLSRATDVPASYSFEAEDGEPLVAWCSDFGDIDLDVLTRRALRENFSLRAAWARVEQANAVARLAGSAELPVLDAQVGAGRSRVGAAAPVGAVERDSFSISLPVAYEIDVWGQIAANADAASLDALATRGSLESIAMTVVASVAEAWFDVVYQRAARNLLTEQVDTNQIFLEIIYLRMGLGQASAPDIYLQRQQIESLEAELVLVEGREAVAAHRLAVLVGEAPQRSVTGDRSSLPSLPSLPAIGVPADLLDQRPDVRAARYQLEAADHRLAAAVVDRLPSVRLTGALTFQAAEIADLFEEIFWSVAGSVSAPLFEGGRNSAEIDRTEAVVDERLYSYAETLLGAMQEVESALVLEHQQLAFIEQLGHRAETAQAALDLERERYRRGVTDYLRVLTALQSVQRIERALLDAHRQLLSHRVQLCRAVGGDWSRDLVPTTRREE